MGKLSNKSSTMQEGNSYPPLSRREEGELVALKTKKGRHERQSFLAEGIRVLEESQRWEIAPRRVVVHWPTLNERAQLLLEKWHKYSIPMMAASAPQFRRLSSTDEPQCIVAEFAIPAPHAGAAPLALDAPHSKSIGNVAKRILVLDSVSDPGNVGTIIRSAVAFGFREIFLCGESVDPYNPKVVRSAAGGIFGCNIVILSTSEAVGLFQNQGVAVIVADSRGVDERNWRPFGDPRIGAKDHLSRIALVIGSEARGVSEVFHKTARELVAITHTDQVESLNAAVAAGILMHHIFLAGSSSSLEVTASEK